MSSAAEVFEHHIAAFAAGNLDEILLDYTDESVMVYGDRVWRGLAGARAFFEMWLDELLPAGCRFDIVDQLVVDDMVYLTWTAESDDYAFDFGTDTFLVHDSKVVRQTVATLHHRK